MTENNHNISDSPTTEDLLGFKKFSVPLARKIASANRGNTPLSIGVYGQWGSGKTSFLLMVDEALKNFKIHPIWFNAWKYEHEDNLWSALLQTILDQAPLHGNVIRRIWVKFRIWWGSLSLRSGLWDTAKKISPILLRSFIFVFFAYVAVGSTKENIIAWLTKMPFGISNLPPQLLKVFASIIAIFSLKPDSLFKIFRTKLGIDYSKFSRKKSYKDHIAFLDEFNSELQHILSLVSPEKPIVIIIDDLDRCLPEKAVQVLEAIKIFLDVEGCVFILAVDREIVEKAISVKYKDIITQFKNSQYKENDISDLSESYFEKIIHLPFSLPPLSPQDSKNLVKALYSLKDVKQSAEIFAIGLPKNPRKIKRVLHSFLFLRELSEEQIISGKITSSLLAKLIIIQNRYPVLYDSFIDNPDFLKNLELFLKNDEITDEDDLDPILIERIKSTATLYPSLREILLYSTDENSSFLDTKLEDYFYILRTVTEVEDFKKETKNIEKEDVEIFSRQLLNQIVSQAQKVRILGSPSLESLEETFVAPKFTQYGTTGSNIAVMTLQEIMKQSARLFIIGQAGSGKTFLLNYISLLLGKTFGADLKEVPKNQLGIENRLFPIFISAREYITELDSQLKNLVPSFFINIVNSKFNKTNISIPDQFFEILMEQGKCMVMIDGLDEINEKNSRYEILDNIESVISRYPHNRFVITSRPTAIFDSMLGESSFKRFEILPMDADQIKQILNYRFKTDRNSDANLHLSELISTSPELSELSKNPLMMNIISSLSEQKGNLPTSRPDLYSEVIETLLQRWDMSRGIKSPDLKLSLFEIKKVLGLIALKLLSRNKNDFNQSEFIREISSGSNLSNDDSFSTINWLKERSGLITEVSPNKYQFTHRSFQEYLAAEQIINSENFSFLLDNIDKNQWQEILYLVLEMVPDATQLVNELLNSNNEKSIRILSDSLDRISYMDPSLKSKIKKMSIKG